MNRTSLKLELDTAIQKFQKEAENLQSRGMDEDVQEAVNIITNSTLAALQDFRDALLKNSCN